MANFRRKNTLCLSLSVLILSMMITVSVFLLSPTGMDARAQEIEKNFSKVESTIDDIDLSNIRASSDTKVLLNESKELAGIGIGGIPLLMEKLESGNMREGYKVAFYIEGLYTLLAIDRMDILLNPEYFDESSAIHPEYAGIKKLMQESKTAIPAIMASPQPVENKLEALSKYGVLSVPYINAQIKNGENGYAAYFTHIGLQYTPEERVDPAAGKRGVFDELPDDKTDFTYEEWNTANRYDLEILSSYIDRI